MPGKRRNSGKNKRGRPSGRLRASQSEVGTPAAGPSIEQATREFLAQDEKLVETSRRRLEAMKKAHRAREKRRRKQKG